MAKITVAGTIDNVKNGTFVVKIALLASDGAEVAASQSEAISVTSNPAPVVGAPVVTVS